MVTLQSELIFSTQTLKGKTQVQIPTDHTLFGITAEYKLKMNEQIFDFVYYSEGAFQVNEVRSWPIGLRQLYLTRLEEILKKRAEQMSRSRSRR